MGHGWRVKSVQMIHIDFNFQLADFKRGQGCVLQLSFLVNFDVRRSVDAYWTRLDSSRVVKTTNENRD